MIWKVIEEFPNYQISDTGIVKNRTMGNWIKIHLNKQYYSISLYDYSNKRTKHLKIHRLIAIHFIPNPNNYDIVDHIDGNKLNNEISNLRWCTQSTNVENWHLNRTNYNKINQYDLKNNLLKTWDSVADIVKELKFNKNSIYGCCSGFTKTHKKFIWKYENQDRKQQIKSNSNINLSDYVSIGRINDDNFPNYYISKDGTKIINKKKLKEITFFIKDNTYKRVFLYNDKKVKKPLYVHKIIDIVLTDDNINKQNNIIEYLEVVPKKEKIIKARGKIVHQIDIKTNKIINTFNSTKEASLAINGTSKSNIGGVCRGKGDTAYGFKWQYAVAI
jgi:hypothetical protein